MLTMLKSGKKNISKFSNVFPSIYVHTKKEKYKHFNDIHPAFKVVSLYTSPPNIKK